jgi:hypothetical protein
MRSTSDTEKKAGDERFAAQTKLCWTSSRREQIANLGARHKLRFAFDLALWQDREQLGNSHEKVFPFYSRFFRLWPEHPRTSTR